MRGNVMGAYGAASKKAFKPRIVRRNVDRRILRFSLCIGVLGTFLAAAAYGVALHFDPDLRNPRKVNTQALSEVHCAGTTCDTSEFTTDWYSESPDYMVDMETKYLLSTPGSSGEKPTRFAPLDFANMTFVRQFEQPSSYTTPDGETWRMFSRPALTGKRKVEILIGCAEMIPSRMLEAAPADLPRIDDRLKQEADRIAANLQDENYQPGRALVKAPKLSADGFTVVDAKDGAVMDWGLWLPTFLPKETKTPLPGTHLALNGFDLDLIQTDSDGRMLAVTLMSLGDVRWLCLAAILVFVATTLIARALSRRFLRNYFIFSRARVPSLDEALRGGEGQHVEFKRALPDDESRADELLKTIAAFANTGDGTIFVGVDDGGKIKGLELDFKGKDRFEHKARQYVRNRIKPTPPVQITFQQCHGLTIACIAVARGEAPAYLLNGVIYYRYGASDVQAQPEDLQRLILEYV